MLLAVARLLLYLDLPALLFVGAGLDMRSVYKCLFLHTSRGPLSMVYHTIQQRAFYLQTEGSRQLARTFLLCAYHYSLEDVLEEEPLFKASSEVPEDMGTEVEVLEETFNAVDVIGWSVTVLLFRE